MNECSLGIHQTELVIEISPSILNCSRIGQSTNSSIDFGQIAKKTNDFSGADLKAVVDQAIEAKLRDAMKDGIPRPIRSSAGPDFIQRRLAEGT